MSIRAVIAAGCGLVAVLAGTAVPAIAAPSPAALTPACASAPAGHARCLTEYRSRGDRRFAVSATPDGLGATDLESAYRLPVDRTSTALVAVSIAYDSPNLESDLNTYRQQYGLGACTTANGCFRKVDQTGAASPLPAVDNGWQLEATLDVSMISAACPHCHILVVEGDSNSFADLAATDDTAVRLGATVVSNSYGGRESGQAMAFAKDYDHPGHPVIASSGDGAFGAAQFPAALSTVIAVGGTELAKAPNARGWSETAWQYASSGCSAYVAKPSWQHDRDCPGRTVADVSAAADGIALYNTIGGGWLTVAGTSASAPLVAGITGLAGNAATAGPGYAYRHAAGLFDVTSGTNDPTTENGGACGDDYLCVAGPGYDGPTGLGTPDGIAAF